MSAIGGTRTEHIADPVGSRVQAALEQATQPARLCPLVNGQLVTGTKFTHGVQANVAHGLGRAFAGCFPSVPSASASFALAATQLDTTKYISLVPTMAGGSGATAVCALWVF